MTAVSVASPEALHAATQVLDWGEALVLPTETSYALAADALDEAASMRVAEAAGRVGGAPLTVAVGALEEARHVARLTPLARRIAQEELPAPLTLLLPALDHLPETITAGRAAVAVRILSHPFARHLASHFGPLALCGARRPGSAPSRTVAQARAGLPVGVGLFLDGGETPGGRSAVIDATGARPAVVRARVLPS